MKEQEQRRRAWKMSAASCKWNSFRVSKRICQQRGLFARFNAPSGENSREGCTRGKRERDRSRKGEMEASSQRMQAEFLSFHLHLHLHLRFVATIAISILLIGTSGGSKIYFCARAQACAPTACGLRFKNLTYPFGADPSSCGLSSDFLLSGCENSSAFPLWKNFNCGNSSGCGKLGPPMVVDIYDQPSGHVTVQGRRDQLGANNRDSGFANLTWIGGDQNGTQAQIPFCKPIPFPDVFDRYLPESINLTSFYRNSTLHFSPYSVFLLFNCSRWDTSAVKSLSLAVRNDSVLCQYYRGNCNTSTIAAERNGSESFAACLQVTPWEQLMLQDVARTLSCTNFTFFVDLKGLNIAGNSNSSLPRPPSNVLTNIQLMWSHADFASEGECQACERTNGWCGYNINGSFRCFCPGNITSDDICSSSTTGLPPILATTKHKPRAWAIGLAIAIPVGAVMVGAAFLVLLWRWWRRRRRRRRRLEAGMITAFSSAWKKNLWTSKRALSLAARYSGPSESCREFAYEELMQSTDGFAAESMVADGGFGTVFSGTLRDGRKVAIKRLFRDNKRRLEHFYNEIRILSSLNHPNLVKLYGFCCFHEQMDLMLVYEYAGNGSLADHLHGAKKKKHSPLPWGLRLRIAHETSQALCYLHSSVSPPIYHRDVKAANILIDEGFHVKLGDFGLSRFVPIDATHVSTVPQGTPGYVDPEYHQCYQLTEKSDVYSFGVVLMELVSGREAVDASRGKGEVNLSRWAMARIVNKSWGELIDPRLHDHDRYPSIDRTVEKSIRCVAELAFTCLQPEKDDRPSMHHAVQVLAHLCDELEVDDYCGYGYDPKRNTSGTGFL